MSVTTALERDGRETFAARHYLPLPAAIPAARVERLAEGYRRLTREDGSGLPRSSPAGGTDGLIVVPERDDAALICRTEYLYGASSEIAAFVDELVTPLVARAAGEPVALFKDKCNEKNPGGGAFPPHQDMAAYQHFGPANFFTAMVPLDPSTLRNGCLNVATNMDEWVAARPDAVSRWFDSNPLLGFYDGGPENGVIEAGAAAGLAWTPVELRPGDVLLFDAFIPHHSEPNGSSRSRRALFLTYNRQREGKRYELYYRRKRDDGANPMFHVATPTRFTGGTAR